MLTFNIAVPDQNPTKKVNPRILEARFGDGYSQRARDGINHILEVWSISFTLRTKTLVDQIDAFLVEHGGTTTFSWTTPDGKTKKFICKSWSRSYVHDGDHSLSCEFEEVAA